MPSEIKDIKFVRKKLGLTQAQLAGLSGVSQSLIAKIEAGSLDPTYSNATKIFSALDSFSRKNDIKSSEIMTPKIISMAPKESAKDAIKKMKKYEISQMPVIDDSGRAVGLISEAIILDAVIENRTGIINDMMEDAPPVLSKDSSVEAVSDIMRHYPLVLISEKGRLKGIITKSDLLRKVYNK